MKPEKIIVTKTIMLERWTCGISSHNHTTEKIAAECIEAQVKRAAKGVEPHNTWDDVVIQDWFWSLKESGKTFREVGEACKFPISPSRARQVGWMILRRRERKLVESLLQKYSGGKNLDKVWSAWERHKEQFLNTPKGYISWFDRMSELNACFSETSKPEFEKLLSTI